MNQIISPLVVRCITGEMDFLEAAAGSCLDREVIPPMSNARLGEGANIRVVRFSSSFRLILHFYWVFIASAFWKILVMK